MNLPENLGDLSNLDFATLIRKAMAESLTVKTQAELVRRTGINRGSIFDYTTGRTKPPQERWNIIRKVLLETPSEIEPGDTIEDVPDIKNLSQKEIIIATLHANRFKESIQVLNEELHFFKDAKPEVRIKLKQILPGKDTGYTVGLLSSIFDEDLLKFWKSTR